MTEMTGKSLKRLHGFSLGLLTLGFLSLLFNLCRNPASFPVVSLYLTAVGAMLAVAVSTKHLIWRQYEK